MTQVTIKKSGNSVVVRIPSPVLKSMALDVNDVVDITMESGRIVLSPLKDNEAPPVEHKSMSMAELAVAVRERLGLTQGQCGEYFGITLNAWQKKEQGDTQLTVAEQYLFQMLTDQHPEYLLLRKLPDDKSPALRAAQAAQILAQYLCGNMPLPSAADALLKELEACMREFNADWQTDIDKAVGDALPDENAVLNEQLAASLAENARLKQQLKEK